jgi:hypothetical protein
MIIGICYNCKKEFRKREQKYKFCSVFCSNNFNKNGLIEVLLPKLSIELAEFVGICLGDGNVSKYQVGITLNSIADVNYVPYVVNLSQLLFPQVKISVIQKRENAIDVRLNSIQVSDYFRKMGIIPHYKKVPDWIFTKFSYRKACVKGLFDTEGSTSQKEYLSKKGLRTYYQFNFRNYDKEIMRFVRDVLLELNLKPTNTLTKSLYISNLKDINIYMKSIGSGNPKLRNKFVSI